MKIAATQPESIIAPQNRPRTLNPLAATDFKGIFENHLADKGLTKTATRTQEPDSATSLLRALSPSDMFRNVKGPVQPLKPLEEPKKPLDEISPLDFIPGQRGKAATEQEKLTATARKWVAQTFYGTLLKQMRNSPFKSKIMDGGRGGEAFMPMLDQRLADHMAKGTDNKLVRSIARKLQAGKSPAASVVPKTNSDNPFQNVRMHVAPNLGS